MVETRTAGYAEVIHFFVALNLFLLSLGGATALLAWWSGLLMEQQWRTEAIGVGADLNRCTRQRDAFARRLRTGERMR